MPRIIQFAMIRVFVTLAWLALHFTQVGFEQCDSLNKTSLADGIPGPFYIHYQDLDDQYRYSECECKYRRVSDTHVLCNTVKKRRKHTQ